MAALLLAADSSVMVPDAGKGFAKPTVQALPGAKKG